MIYHRPDLTRRQIVLHAGQQFIEGDVMHWWHDDNGIGLRTRFSDDLAWLPYVTATYVSATGDTDLLDETAPFIRGDLLQNGQHEVCLKSQPCEVSASVYEHCCRALEKALTTGSHSLPLMGSGDWNDGMNRVGAGGRGESVWLGFFLHAVLGQMIPLCERRKDQERVEEFSAHRLRLATALDEAGWDGSWYRRAFYDNGEPLGSAASDECQIDAIAQAWAVLSGVAPPERAGLAIDAAEQRLVDDRAGLIRLLAPPFDRTPHDPGYIKGYVPGVRENGGQYTHGVLWLVRAVAELGRGTRAVDLLRMLSPVTRTATAERTAVYQTEPYVVAADVYSEPPHVGRGGWTWYTGSAGWMFRVAVESILGLSIENGDTLVLNPSISAQWPQCRLRYRLPDGRTQYDILIENPTGKETRVTSATVDGCSSSVVDGAARIRMKRDGEEHRVVVRL
jgi:cyclic beta-1,2-glucan synthetase